MFNVTLKSLRQHMACITGYNRLVRHLQGKPFTAQDEDRETYIRFAHKEPIAITEIVESNGLDDALWALRCVIGHDRDIRLFAVWCARQVQHLMNDRRSVNALDVAERYANGLATEEELAAARDAARDACAAAWDASATKQSEMLVRMCNGQAPWQH